MLRRAAIVCWIIAIALGAATEPAAADPAGLVDRLKGNATATRGHLARPLMTGAEVFSGDLIATGVQTRLQIRLNSGTVVTLGDNSLLRIDADVPPERETSVLDLLQGVFLAATTAIGRAGEDALTVRTPSAVLGVRGTTIWGEQQPDKLSVVLLDGTAVVVDTPYGSVTLDQKGLGTDVLAGQAPTSPITWSAKRVEESAAKVAFE